MQTEHSKVLDSVSRSYALCLIVSNISALCRACRCKSWTSVRFRADSASSWRTIWWTRARQAMTSLSRELHDVPCAFCESPFVLRYLSSPTFLWLTIYINHLLSFIHSFIHACMHVCMHAFIHAFICAPFNASGYKASTHLHLFTLKLK